MITLTDSNFIADASVYVCGVFFFQSSEQPRSVTFNICRTHIDEESCHPEEGMYCALTPDAWFGFMGSDGRVSNESLIRKVGHTCAAWQEGGLCYFLKSVLGWSADKYGLE